jgi:hypothetical protein
MPSNTPGVTREKDYAITLLDVESLDRIKDTWCIPHCLNTVHEGAGDERAHEKLRADRLRGDAKIHPCQRLVKRL